MAGKRERIEPQKGEQRYVRRDAKGHFTDSQDDVGRASAQDQKRQAQRGAKKGQGDKGDRKP